MDVVNKILGQKEFILKKKQDNTDYLFYAGDSEKAIMDAVKIHKNKKSDWKLLK